jgi:hypothetical protein
MGRPSQLTVNLDFANSHAALARVSGFADRILTGEISTPGSR